MISEHPSFEPPADPDVPIWRYMDLAKFLWMLQRNALFFARADQLGDPYEGHYTEPYVTSLNESVETMMKDTFGKADQGNVAMWTLMIQGNHRRIKKEAFVNCWHMNEEESAAMWKLYTSHHQSVCVQSSYRQLAEQLPSSCRLGQVRYVDYRKVNIPSSSILNFITHKRCSYAHERELRAVIWSPKPEKVIWPQDTENVEMHPSFTGKSVFRSGEDIGKVVPVHLQKLISAVLVSPNSDETFCEIVRGLCNVYRLAVAVRMSGVNAPPAY